MTDQAPIPIDSEIVQKPTIKLYSVKAITLATFFGGILAGGYFMASNFKAVNQKNKATTTWIVTFLFFLLLIISLFIPLLDKIPSIVYSATFTILAGTMARKYQDSFIDMHLNSGGEYYSTGRIVLITISFLILLLSIGVGILFYINYLQGAN